MRADQVDQRQDDNHAGCERIAHALRHEMAAIIGEGYRIERHHHDVAEHQEGVHAGGEQPFAEGAADEGHRPTRPREGEGQPDIGIGGQEGERAADQEGQPGGTLRLDRGQADGGKDAAADDAADPDREGTQEPQGGLGLGLSAHGGTTRRVRCQRWAWRQPIQITVRASRPSATGRS